MIPSSLLDTALRAAQQLKGQASGLPSVLGFLTDSNILDPEAEVAPVSAESQTGTSPAGDSKTKAPPLIDRKTATWLGLAGILAQAFGGGGADLINGFIAGRQKRPAPAPPPAKKAEGESDQKKQKDDEASKESSDAEGGQRLWNELGGTSFPTKLDVEYSLNPRRKRSSGRSGYFPELDWDWSDNSFAPYAGR